MFNREEKVLDNLRSDYDNVAIPENIDQYIHKGMVKYPIRKKLFQYGKIASAAAVIAFFILTAGIRLSPVFADYLQDVPVLKHLVKLVNYDKGLKAALENNFVQNIGVSDEHGGIKFTVDSLIVDEARMIVFYTLENNSDYNSIYMNQANFSDGKGNSLPISCSYGFMYDKAELRKIQDKINVNFSEGMDIPDVIHLEIQLLDREKEKLGDLKILPYTWKAAIPIDKSRFENLKQVYSVGQTIEIEGQKITVDKATVYPTKVAVDLSFPEENSMKLFSFENVRITNAKGEVLSSIINDVTASRPNDNHIILYFESDYFDRSESLYLHLSSIRALDKDKTDVLVDLEQKELLDAPDERLTLHDVIQGTRETEIRFLLNGDVFTKDQVRYHISTSGVYDKNGKELKVTGTSNFQGADDSLQEILITLEGVDFESPLKVLLNDYPNRIKGDFKIRLK